MKLIVGLGNPGIKYQSTRHNAGRMMVEYAAQKLSQKWTKKPQLQASLAAFGWEGEKIVLAYPEIMMNISGEAVKRLVKEFEINPSKDLLVVMDEIALPFGKLRLRPRGSNGGHNGLKSVERELATSHYPRLRIGIGQPPAEEAKGPELLPGFVLGKWTGLERKDLPVIMDLGFEAFRLWVSRGIEETMNIINPSDEKS